MSKVISIEAKDGKVLMHLECGHDDIGDPAYSYEAETWAEHIQQGERPIVVGKTRLRCNKNHERNYSCQKKQ